MKPPQLYIYDTTHDPHNRMVVNMWERMVSDGDVDRLFSSMTLTRFLAMLQPPNGMLYAIDHNTVYFAMWFEPFLGGLSVGVWVPTNYRRTRLGLEAFLEAYRLLLACAPCLFGVTKQENLLPAHVGLGYDILGRAPGLWDGSQDAWLVMLTREGHAKALQRIRRRERTEVVHG